MVVVMMVTMMMVMMMMILCRLLELLHQSLEMLRTCPVVINAQKNYL